VRAALKEQLKISGENEMGLIFPNGAGFLGAFSFSLEFGAYRYTQRVFSYEFEFMKRGLISINFSERR
jgi:hypothetical protein